MNMKLKEIVKIVYGLYEVRLIKGEEKPYVLDCDEHEQYNENEVLGVTSAMIEVCNTKVDGIIIDIKG